MTRAKGNIPFRKRQTRIRHLLALALMFSLLLHPQAWNSWTLLLRAKIRAEVHEIKQDTAGAESTLIKIPVKWLEEGHPQLVWTEEDEFRYFGEMYDILRQEVHHDTIWYYCYHDEAETALLNGLFAKLEAGDESLPDDELPVFFVPFFSEWQLNQHKLKDFYFQQRQVLNEGRQNLFGRTSDAPLPLPPEGSPLVFFL